MFSPYVYSVVNLFILFIILLATRYAKSHYNTTMSVLSFVCLSIELSKMNDNGKGTMGCGSVMGLSWGLVGGVRKRKMENGKTCSSATRTVYVHYFKGIRQGALQSNYVMLLGARGDTGWGLR